MNQQQQRVDPRDAFVAKWQQKKDAIWDPSVINDRMPGRAVFVNIFKHSPKSGMPIVVEFNTIGRTLHLCVVASSHATIMKDTVFPAGFLPLDEVPQQWLDEHCYSKKDRQSVVALHAGVCRYMRAELGSGELVIPDATVQRQRGQSRMQQHQGRNDARRGDQNRGRNGKRRDDVRPQRQGKSGERQSQPKGQQAPVQQQSAPQVLAEEHVTPAAFVAVVPVVTDVKPPKRQKPGDRGHGGLDELKVLLAAQPTNEQRALPH